MAATPTTPGWLLPCDSQARLLVNAPCGRHVSQNSRPHTTPWTGYLRFAHGQLVGGGGFAAAPVHGRVEIGYFTLPGWQRQGHGLATAAALLAVARAADARLTVTATTVRQAGTAADASPSGRILQNLGFGPAVPAQDTDASPVWHWAAGPLKPTFKPARHPAPNPAPNPAQPPASKSNHASKDSPNAPLRPDRDRCAVRAV